MKNEKIRLSVFIVPNAGTEIRYLFQPENHLKKLAAVGIAATEEDPVYEVWIHCPDREIKNLTDHGWGVLAEELGTDTRFAPGYLPTKILLSVKEGESRIFTAPSGREVELVFEQLPTRYGGFGKIEEVAQLLVDRTAENILFQRSFRRKK